MVLEASLRADRVKGALYGAFIADALAAPTHWFYGGRSQVQQEYGPSGIRGYTKPNEHLAGSIMNKSSTTGGGRGGYGDGARSIVGRVINHGKLAYWRPGADFHYHATLAAGENTLEAQLLRIAVKVAAGGGGGSFDSSAFLGEYVRFMTTEGSHNDCYAATAHRMFFANRDRGLPLEQCPDNDRHNVDAVDSLTIPIAPSLFASSAPDCHADVAATVTAIRASPSSVAYAHHFSDLLRTIVTSQPAATFRDTLQNMSTQPPASFDVAKAVSRSRSTEDPVTACYLEQSYPSALFMMYKYAGALTLAGGQTAWTRAFEEAVLANANRGGENVAQGSLIGAAMGAACGFSSLPASLVDGLAASESLRKDIDAFVEASPFVKHG
ncbi:hypothetical protein DIPPA_23726 [Diplonema papillatum]|nr:hypothetical protein DIPPA_23726 [Diplonema papillatum]|eukprot:gene2964-4657_t